MKRLLCGQDALGNTFSFEIPDDADAELLCRATWLKHPVVIDRDGAVIFDLDKENTITDILESIADYGEERESAFSAYDFGSEGEATEHDKRADEIFGEIEQKIRALMEKKA